MGTALTGNTISSSYLGLIKTTDSAAISSSAKVITDGAGNDSPLYLSTSRLGIGITPTSTLHVSGDFTLTGAFKDTSGDAGSSGQILSSTATGTNWIDNDVGDITSVVAGDGLTGGGTSGAVTINAGAGNLIDVQADQIDVDLSELTTSTSDGDGDFFAVVDSANAQKKLTKGNINLSGFNNDIVSGTTGTLAKFTSSSAVGDSIVSESSSTLLIDPTAGGSHVSNIALTLLGVSGQDEQVYIYASGSSAENATIKLIPVGAGYGQINASGNGLRLGSDSNPDVITLKTSSAEITVDVQLIGTAPNIIFYDTAVTKNIAKILGNVDSAGTNGGKLEFQTVADSGSSYITALAIDDSQQVGIGTTTPSALLNLESSSTSAFLIANRTNAVDGTKNLIDFKLDASDDNSYSAGSIGVEAEGTWSSTAGSRDGSIIFRPSLNGTDTTAVTITSAGNVCVGSSASGVSGTIDLSVGLAGTTTGGITLWSTTTGSHSLGFGDATSGTARYEGYIEYDHDDDSMEIATDHTVALRISKSQQVEFKGIGGTDGFALPYDENPGYSNISWGGGGVLFREAEDSYLTGNIYYYRTGGASAWKAKYTGGGTYIAQTGGEFQFATSPSVSAGATASLDTKMTISNVGNVDIANTTPLTPILKLKSNIANGYTLIGDNYVTGSPGESQVTLGCQYSSAGLVLGQLVKPSNTTNDVYLSTQDTYAGKPSALVMAGGDFKFLNTDSSASTATDSAVTLYERMRINSAGNVGINETNPDNKLEISDTSVGTDSTADDSNFIKLTNKDIGTVNEVWGLGFSSESGGTDYLGGFVQALGNFTSNFNTSLIFGTRGTSGNATERMRIDSSGNVDIGGAGIAACRLTSRGSTTGASAYSIEGCDSAGATKFAVRDDGSVFFGGTSCSATDSSGTFQLTNANVDGGYEIYTRNASSTYINALQLDGDGNVGINITPSASVKLLVKGKTTDSTATAIQANDSSNADLFVVKCDGSTTMKMATGSTGIYFNGISTVGNSGTVAGNAAVSLTFTNVDDSSMYIECIFAHYGYIGTYGCALVATFSNGPNLQSQEIQRVDSTNGGAWSITRTNATTFVVAKSTGSYAGTGAWYVKINGKTVYAA